MYEPLASSGVWPGTYLARNRWYDPVLGRWLQRDPAGYVDGMSMYEYVRNIPYGSVDPMGLAGFFEWLGFGNDMSAPGQEANFWNYADTMIGGFGKGFAGGGVIIANSATGGLITPLDEFTGELIENNGTTYEIANFTANTGMLALDVASGKALLTTAGKAASRTLARNSDEIVDGAVAVGSVAVNVAQGTKAAAATAGAVGVGALGGGSLDNLVDTMQSQGGGRLPPKGTPERAAIEAARSQGIVARQAQELANIRAGGKGSGIWTEAELTEIRRTGEFPVDAYWHHDPT